MIFLREIIKNSPRKFFKSFHKLEDTSARSSDIDGASYFVLTFSQQSRHKDRQKLAPKSSDSLYVIGLYCWQGLCLGCQLWGKRTQQKSWDAESFIDSRNYLQVQLLWPRCTLTNTTDTTPTHQASALRICQHHRTQEYDTWRVWWCSQMMRAEASHTSHPPPVTIFSSVISNKFRGEESFLFQSNVGQVKLEDTSPLNKNYLLFCKIFSQKIFTSLLLQF